MEAKVVRQYPDTDLSNGMRSLCESAKRDVALWTQMANASRELGDPALADAHMRAVEQLKAKARAYAVLAEISDPSDEFMGKMIRDLGTTPGAIRPVLRAILDAIE